MTVFGPPWRFLVTTLAHVSITFLDRLAADREVVFALGKAALATGTLPSDNPEVNIIYDSTPEPFVSYSNRFLIGFRRDGAGPAYWTPRFAGILMQLGDDAGSDQAYSHYTAYDPRQYLASRPIVTSTGTLLPPEGRHFFNTAGSTILTTLLTDAIAAHGSVHIDIGTGGPPWAGTIETTATLDYINFEQGATLGDAFDQLEATGTMDIILTPVYDPNIRPGILCDLSVYILAGAAKPAAVFGWDSAPQSLIGINRLHDGTALANKIQPYTALGGLSVATDLAQDAASIAKYGQYWSQQMNSGQISRQAVALLASADLALRKTGKTTLTINPTPEASPEPFIDYWLGDTVPIVASANFREALSTDQRVYAVPIKLSDDELETVGPLLLAPEGA